MKFNGQSGFICVGPLDESAIRFSFGVREKKKSTSKIDKIFFSRQMLPINFS